MLLAWVLAFPLVFWLTMYLWCLKAEYEYRWEMLLLAACILALLAAIEALAAAMWAVVVVASEGWRALWLPLVSAAIAAVSCAVLLGLWDRMRCGF